MEVGEEVEEVVMLDALETSIFEEEYPSVEGVAGVGVQAESMIRNAAERRRVVRIEKNGMERRFYRDVGSASSITCATFSAASLGKQVSRASPIILLIS